MRHQASSGQAHYYGTQRHSENLQHIDAEDDAAVRPCDLKRRNAGALAFQIAADAVSDADPCDHQRSQPDQRQKLAHTFNETAGARCAIRPVGDFPSCTWKGGLKALCNFGRVGVNGQADAILAFKHAAGLDQAGGGERRQPDDRDRANGKAFAKAIRLLCNDPVHAKRSFPEPHGATGLDVQPVGKRRTDIDFARAGPADRASIAKAQFAIKWIGAIDRL